MTELEELQKYAQENGEHYFGIDDLPDDWEEIDDGQWVDEGKYSYNTTIVSKNGKFLPLTNLVQDHISVTIFMMWLKFMKLNEKKKLSL